MSGVINTKETHDTLVETLRVHQCVVTFTKINGDVRVMPCTLMPEFLPPITESATPKKAMEPNYDVLSVWCLDKKSWRSFRVANVTDIKVLANS